MALGWWAGHLLVCSKPPSLPSLGPTASACCSLSDLVRTRLPHRQARGATASNVLPAKVLGRYFVYHRRCTAAPQPVQILLLLLRSAPPKG
ncbi:hypothetical protein M440DRAFT_1009110 [Trichoderma longibrachiatum ATCC 18648]|uniref:Uncharacterized protein n=1 Tax=Trichoderma longibrachiatum ATCC 18648 TaxID=983965 RepID=A0A2T4CHV2_TRILO|nr:hypothetical protein M440DRAFT_1009110 [Trichoderma longibrachiatum ATCC 18648]